MFSKSSSSQQSRTGAEEKEEARTGRMLGENCPSKEAEGVPADCEGTRECAVCLASYKKTYRYFVPGSNEVV